MSATFWGNFPTFINSNSSSVARQREHAVKDGKKLLCSQDSPPAPPLCDIQHQQAATGVTGRMIDGSVSSPAQNTSSQSGTAS